MAQGSEARPPRTTVWHVKKRNSWGLGVAIIAMTVLLLLVVIALVLGLRGAF